MQEFRNWFLARTPELGAAYFATAAAKLRAFTVRKFQCGVEAMTPSVRNGAGKLVPRPPG